MGPDLFTPNMLNPKQTWLNWNEMFVAAVRCVLYVLWLYTEPPASERAPPPAAELRLSSPAPGECARVGA